MRGDYAVGTLFFWRSPRGKIVKMKDADNRRLERIALTFRLSAKMKGAPTIRDWRVGRLFLNRGDQRRADACRCRCRRRCCYPRLPRSGESEFYPELQKRSRVRR